MYYQSFDSSSHSVLLFELRILHLTSKRGVCDQVFGEVQVMGPDFFGLRMPWTLLSPLLCKWPSYLDITMGKSNPHTWSMKEILRSDHQFQEEAWLQPRDKYLRKSLINILFSLAKPSEQCMCPQSVSGLVESTMGTSLTPIPCRRSLLHSSLSYCDIFSAGLWATYRSPKHLLRF